MHRMIVFPVHEWEGFAPGGTEISTEIVFARRDDTAAQAVEIDNEDENLDRESTCGREWRGINT